MEPNRDAAIVTATSTNEAVTLHLIRQVLASLN